MPNIAAHMICSKLVADNLNINDPEFIKGNLLPDIIDGENSHKKISGKHYYIPDIPYFINNLDLNDNLYLGYLSHLLLDKYFLENYIYDQVNGEEVFISRLIYKEYDIINYELLKRFNMDTKYLNNILKDFKVPIDIEKYNKNIKCLNIINTSDNLTYLNIDSFSKFLVDISNRITRDLKEVKMMNVNLICPIIILENESNPNIRKNDVKKFKLLVDSNNNLITIKVNITTTLKEIARNEITNIISSNDFHLEQVYTLGEEKYYFDKAIDIIYLGITNIENIKALDNKYKLIDFDISNNNITLDSNTYQFKTREHITNNNIEYYHDINVDDIKLEKKLLEIIIAYKHLRSKLDNSDIIFKFMEKTFTLEDVRIVYEMIKEVSVDKSNFRKKIVKYCEETTTDTIKKGYRQSKMYTFKLLKGDIWL